MEEKKILVGADHAGFGLKEEIKDFLSSEGWLVSDLGPFAGEESCDYTLTAFQGGERVAAGEFPFAVLICGTGMGMAIAANKVNGIRAVTCQDQITAFYTRAHNDANVLCLGGRITTPLVAQEVVRVFLRTPFSGGRHQRRIGQILDFEQAQKTGC